jgi:proline dehydrogenase
MLEVLPKAAFHVMARSAVLKRMASRYGMRRPDSFARRFIAGETVDEAIVAARAIERAGMTITLDMLGESVASAAEATEATRAYVGIMRQIAEAGIGRNVSIKLTQLGLDVDRATCIDNLRRIHDVAASLEFFVRIDMESSAYTERTLETFETLWSIGYRNAGVVIQSCLKRSEGDVRHLNALGARVRLVKGAYREPRDVACQVKAEVDAAFVKLMKVLLKDGTQPAIATHDPVMLEAARDFAGASGIGKDRFEFQMLYGIRRDLQTQLTGEGYAFRVYVPFGTEWFPYFMRRLGERPANLGFVMKSMLKEKR